MFPNYYNNLSQRNKQLVYAKVKELGLEGNLGGLQLIHRTKKFLALPQ